MHMPLEVALMASSSKGVSTIGTPNWIISLPWPFMGLFETVNVCPVYQNVEEFIIKVKDKKPELITRKTWLLVDLHVKNMTEVEVRN